MSELPKWTKKTDAAAKSSLYNVSVGEALGTAKVASVALQTLADKLTHLEMNHNVHTNARLVTATRLKEEVDNLYLRVLELVG